LLAVPAAYVHLARHVISHPHKARRYILAHLYHFATEFMPYDYRLILVDLASIIDKHFVSHAGPGRDLIDALVGAANRSCLDSNFYFLVSYRRLRLVFSE
jgi:hypothetical protein